MDIDVIAFIIEMKEKLKNGTAPICFKYCPSLFDKAASYDNQNTVATVKLGQDILSHEYGYMTAKYFKEWILSNYPIGERGFA